MTESKTEQTWSHGCLLSSLPCDIFILILPSSVYVLCRLFLHLSRTSGLNGSEKKECLIPTIIKGLGTTVCFETLGIKNYICC